MTTKKTENEKIVQDMTNTDSQPIVTDSNKRLAYCPICHKQFPTSDYLQTVFSDDIGAEWFANMITHYRHQHRAYDKWIRYVSQRKGVPYEDQKATINEQAKRQIMRKCKNYMRENNIGAAQVLQMQNNSKQTLALLMKVFSDDKETIMRSIPPICKSFDVTIPRFEICINCSSEGCYQRVTSAP